MRIKDNPKSNAEGGVKKESKRKTNKQKTVANNTVTSNKNEKAAVNLVKEKEGRKKTPPKDVQEKQVNQPLHNAAVSAK